MKNNEICNNKANCIDYVCDGCEYPFCDEDDGGDILPPEPEPEPEVPIDPVIPPIP